MNKSIDLSSAFEPAPIFGADYVSKVVPFINSVRDELRIVIYDWRLASIPDVSALALFNQAIFDAVKRGVKVRAIVSHESTKAILLKHGVIAKVLPSEKCLHTKLLILDRYHIICGSHNFTQSAFSTNHELSIYFVVKNFENPYIAYFENLWSY
jgi:phosphatidylserine/phosphatidylglycerophosphate/cardiolipin synthase-like enzyme